MPRVQPRYLIAGAFALAAALYAYTAGALIPDELTSIYFANFWFQGDLPRVVANLTDRWSDYYRAAVHPAFAVTLTPVSLVLSKLLGLPPWESARVVTALGAGALGGLFFLIAQRISGRLLDAALGTCALLASAAFLFWASAPETYVWGGASILLVLFVVGRERMPPNQAAFTLASAASLGVTVTNWMAGVIAAAIYYPWRRAAVLTALAFAIVAALAAISVNVFPSPHAFLRLGEEGSYINSSVAAIARTPPAFFLSSVIAPPIALVPHGEGPDYTETILSVQNPNWLTLGGLGATASIIWLGALGLGFFALVSRLRPAPLKDRFALTLTLLIGAQFVLHAFYGEETFLYALHFAPLLILATLYAATRWRIPCLVLLAGVTLIGGANNWNRFGAVTAIARETTTGNERARVRDAQHARPQDYWPRSAGHVPLGAPGLAEEAKAYLEPGGGFSPSVGSFGVSILTHDAAGAVLRSSDTMPVDQTRSTFLADGIGVDVETPDYALRWSNPAPGHWRLLLSPRAHELTIALRSVGPAGAPLTEIRRDGAELVLENRWRVRFDAGAELMRLGLEGPGWATRTSSDAPQAVRDANGWCFATLRVTPGAAVSLDIIDPEAPAAPPSALPPRGLRSGLTLDLPDPRFAASLDAQVTQILQGAVGDELRPGDPTNYPLAWQRDAAITIVALIRAGRPDAARALVDHIARVDYFGGFGAETDAPGLALWAIGETSRALSDPAFDSAMAPHVARKAADILAFISPAHEVRRDYAGPLVPAVAGRDAHGVAIPSTDGLIHGRMDWHDPALSLTALSILGLEEGVAFETRRSGTAPPAWSAAAAGLRAAWTANAHGPDLTNARTLAFALSPSFVADPATFRPALERAWTEAHDETGAYRTRPLWPYFDLAHARQWLLLGEPERSWAVLDYFWRESPHPGLYTLWESDREENNFGRWTRVRGWVRPTHVTPHYWASAELLLLQTTMLAYADRTPGREALVIGAGVPPTWTTSSLSASGVITEIGAVDWRWSGGVMRVRAPAGTPIRLGPGFPENARITRSAR